MKPRRRADPARFWAAAAGLPLGHRRWPGALAPQPASTSGAAPRWAPRRSLSLWHAERAASPPDHRPMLGEVARLEAVFSLSDPDSELSRLNRDGALAAPSHDLVRRARGSAPSRRAQRRRLRRRRSSRCGSSMSRPFRASAEDATGPDRARRSMRPQRAGRLRADRRSSAGRVALGPAGMAMTLNGIAQG